jgi:hypothetical protein
VATERNLDALLLKRSHSASQPRLTPDQLLNTSRRERAVRAEARARASDRFLGQLELSADDSSIIRYLATVVKGQQLIAMSVHHDPHAVPTPPVRVSWPKCELIHSSKRKRRLSLKL